jgi:hypothetical protein
MQIDLGPSAPVDLQWNTYYDAADQAGQSRRWGGIHPSEDDYPARVTGSQVGKSAYAKAEKYWTGNIRIESVVPTTTIQPNGDVLVTWNGAADSLLKLQKSTDQATWTDVTANAHYTTTGSFTDTNPAAGTYYRVVGTFLSAARVWNEQLMAAIRRNVPNPPAHARNLFHTAVAMYNAWAAYDTTAVGYIYNEKASPLPADLEAARREAISYAAYRVLRSRFATGAGTATSLSSFDAKLAALGYSPTVGQAATTNDPTPAELGKRVGQAILNWGAGDGFGNLAYPQAYTAAVNPNMDPARALPVLGNNGEFPSRPNMPLGVGIPLIADPFHGYITDTDPNFWQPLALSTSVTQNGIPTAGGSQTFVGVQGMSSTPFSLTRSDPLKPWIDIGPPSRLSMPGQPSATDATYKANALDVLRKHAKLNDLTEVDFSPGAYGNNPLGSDAGTGHPVNPVTNQPYAPNMVRRGDFFRVLAEFWADGPNSETPPGHWHVLANELADNPLLVKKVRGTGPTLNDLEWDVKAYFAISAATHDAACACWSIKRYYNGPRPITMIRYMGSMGQSSNPAGPSYHTQGLPLEDGVVEVITAATTTAGAKHELIWNVYTNAYEAGSQHLGKIAVFSWPAEHPDNLPAPSIATHQSLVRWMLASDWLPFQRKTFNTPAFPGYTSGHSTFSRAAAEAVTLLTGSPSFPGGFGHHTVAANSMQIDLGPTAPVDLQWNTYYDAADQAGQSRRWGGIHPVEDDHPARIVGSQVGKSAFALAEQYWTGAILNETIQPVVTLLPGGGVKVTWNAVRGMYHKLQTSTDLIIWTDPPYTQSYANGALATDSSGIWTDTSPLASQKYYRVRRSTSP